MSFKLSDKFVVIFLTKEEKNFKHVLEEMSHYSPSGLINGASVDIISVPWKELELLDSMGLILLDRNQQNPFIKITKKGYSYFYFKKIEIRDFMLKSVFTPVFISLVTTLITLWVTSL